MSDSMHALRIHAQAGPEALIYEPAAVPEPGIGDVLVRVGAASFTPTELSWPSTWVDRAVGKMVRGPFTHSLPRWDGWGPSL